MNTETTIRDQLARRKMTVSDLMKLTGQHRQTITAALDGDYSKTKYFSLVKIKKALGLRLMLTTDETPARFFFEEIKAGPALASVKETTYQRLEQVEVYNV